MTDPFSIAIITGSPSKPSRTAALASQVEQRLTREAFRVFTIQVRDLPAQALLHGEIGAPAIVQARSAIEQADGVVIASPIYKAAYSGVLKLFLDVLPARALEGKVVLPLLTGGAPNHALALDYALRPVLQALEPSLVVSGLFLLDKAVTVTPEGSALLDDEATTKLEAATRSFIDGVRALAQWRVAYLR